MLQFETGKTYFARSICDHDCVFSSKIEKRTEKSVWIKDFHTGELVRKTIKVSFDGEYETFSPFGVYSMSPTITAEKVIGA